MSKREQHAVVMGVIGQYGKVLLGLRHSPWDPPNHGLWHSVGGLVDFGELPDRTVVREVAEETGLKVKIIPGALKIGSTKYRRMGIPRHLIFIIYGVKVVGGKLKERSRENTAWVWVTKKSYPKLKLTAGTKQALKWWFSQG